jgi:MATE family multidrug resistance protein
VRLALPVAIVQVAIMTMGAVDTIMVGRVSPTDLAAVALGNLYFFGVAVFGMGVLFALDPVIAQAVGARDDVGIARGVQRGGVLSLVLTVLATLLLLPAGRVLALLNQPDDVVPVAAGYALASIPRILPFYLFNVLRQSLQAMGRVAPILITALLANVANVFFNWVLIFGNLGAPAMGAVGSGWATSLSRWFMTFALLAIAWPLLRSAVRPLRRDALALRPLVRFVRLGAPIGAQQFLEFGVFGAAGILMGWMGTIAMASAGAGLLTGTGFMACTAVLFLTAPDFLARVYTNEAPVIQIAALLLPIAGIFQVFDGIQVVAAGVLRGVADTRVPMLVNLIGFWAVGLPVSAWLGFGLDLGPPGLWWGLAAGIGAVAALLLLRVRARFGRDLRRLILDEDH